MHIVCRGRRRGLVAQVALHDVVGRKAAVVVVREDKSTAAAWEEKGSRED